MNILKKTLVAAGLVLAATTVAQAGSFTNIRTVSDASVGSQYPNVAYYNNVIHVVWVGYPGGAGGEIYYARSTNGGGTFSTPVILSDAAKDDDRPVVTAGPNGVYVGWNSNNNTGAVYVRRSTDGGASFGGEQLVGGAEGGGYSRITDIFTDGSNNVHVLWYDNNFTTDGSGQVIHRMTCDGSNWGAVNELTKQSVDGVYDNEQPRMGQAAGRLYVTFRTSRNGDPQGGWPPYSIHMLSGTLSGCGVSWVYPSRLVAGGTPVHFAGTYRPEVFGDAGGTLHLGWWDMTQGANVRYRRMNGSGFMLAPMTVTSFGLDHLEPGGLSSVPGQAYGGFQAPPAIVSNGTTAFLGYQRQSNFINTNFEYGPIYLRESADNGGTWGAEQKITTTDMANTPRFALGGAGNQTVAIVWSDIAAQPPQVKFRTYTLGAVSGPSFQVSPDAFSFGSKGLSSQTTQVFTLVNGGTAGTINGIGFAAGSKPDFAVTSTTCGGSLGAGASCTITVRFTPQALGSRSATLSVSTNAADSPAVAALSGTGVGSDFASNVSGVITGYYETILGRSPEPSGLAFWQSEASRVQGLGADVREVFFTMSIQFFNSTEYLNRNTSNTQYLTDLYRTFFQREPDGPGMAFWQSFLDGGMDRGALLTNFLFSTEFSNQMSALFGTASVRAEVNVTIDLYRGILGVLPDSAGFNYWLGRIRQAQCTNGNAVIAEVNTIAAAFISSPEYSQRETARPAGQRNGMHVGDLYNAFLRRGADLSGYNYWTGQLNGGQTRDFVRTQFLQSPEFQNRVAQVISTPCIPQ
jgi:hypothetical protein